MKLWCSRYIWNWLTRNCSQQEFDLLILIANHCTSFINTYKLSTSNLMMKKKNAGQYCTRILQESNIKEES